MTAVGYAIHDTLTREEGIHPVQDETRYYEEIDKRIRARFPDYFKGGSGTRNFSKSLHSCRS